MNTSGKTVRWLIWIYFWLLIFEGALRKWILPGLSTPLLLVRDPVVVAIYLMAISERRLPRTVFIPWILGLAIACSLASLSGQGNIGVTIFGLHANFLHLPLIFIIPQYFDAAEVRRVGKWVLLVLLPMAVLATLQFRAGPDARLNVGVGGEIGGQLFAAAGKVRASGTFSFVTGLVSFLSLAAAFLCYDLLEKRVYPRLLVLAALPALILAMGVSGSRSAVMAVSVVFACVGLVCLVRWEKFGRAFLQFVLIYAVYMGLSRVSTFREGIEVQRTRFESGGGLKVGIVERYFSDFSSAIVAMDQAPFLGYGLGLGTNAGAAYVSGIRGFLLAEGEWSRVILESGPILGPMYLLLRVAIIGYAFRKGWGALRFGQGLPMLLMGMSGLEMLTGQFGQSASLGFAVLGMGLTLAATNFSNAEKPIPEYLVSAPPAPALRGRSRYAEALHGELPAHDS